MTASPTHWGNGFRRPDQTSRRRFLLRASELCLAAVVMGLPTHAASGDTDARTAVQWARIKRTLSPADMANCRKVAEKLTPRMRALLKGPDWQTQTLKTIAHELKAAGVKPIDRSPLDPACAKEAESLRGEAQNTGHGSGNAIAAGLAVAAATLATVPVTGPIIAAVLLLIAAVIILLGQLMAKGREDQAAAKEKETVRKLQSDLVAEMESHPDCEFKKKPD